MYGGKEKPGGGANQTLGGGTKAVHQTIELSPDALLATAVPEPMATPISAFLRAGASFTPSPVCGTHRGITM